MGAWGFRIATIVAACVLLYFAPLIHVTRIEPADVEDRFDAVEFAEAFWTERLLPATADAASATQVAAAMEENAAKAGEQYGVRVGVSRGFLLFLRGVGEVQAADDVGVRLSLDGGGEVRLLSRKVFGSTIRDATGLLKSSESPGSREYNLIADEINRLATARAITRLEGIAVGDRLRFAGCTKVVSSAGYKPPLEIIPVLVEAAK